VIATAICVMALVVLLWVYAGYPTVLAVLARVRPRPRQRARLTVPVSVVIAAHNEGRIIGQKVTNVRASDYPADLVEIVVASDGSTDRTVDGAQSAGATVVLDLPRVGKLAALNGAVSRCSGDVLVFTDADSTLEASTLAELLSNFSDPSVGAVAANELHVVEHEGLPVASGEGLYWRYEQAIKHWEDRVGNAVSASGRLYAIRRDLFRPSAQSACTDDFVISTQAVRSGRRLAFDENARVLVTAPADGGTEFHRKVRVMNRGLRGACALVGALLTSGRWAYLLQLVFHKILRRFTGFFLVTLVVANAFLAAGDRRWWLLLVPQLTFYALAACGLFAQAVHRNAPRACWIAYYFFLANLAAAVAVCSLARRQRYETWEPALTRATAKVAG
jgi:cellulose synthase/poly-beta-1,6-N-acetylglucosamine synthase-like glycosyltransferase